MQILRRKNLTGVVGLMAAALAAGVLTMPGQAHAAEAAYWTVDCDKTPATGDPGAHDLIAMIYKTGDPNKGAISSFKAAGETLTIRNWSGAMMRFTLKWATADGSRIEKAWERHLGTGGSVTETFNIPEGRKVYTSVGTPGGSTAYCNGIS
ncbi:hypothetical protein [Streptomyces sp. NPDC047315]|uniref:hypothetical protein n=1 Tax=Streptomyces sp. NPDC047315 TaxID=3155142 RepID=UPI0033C8B205